MASTLHPKVFLSIQPKIRSCTIQDFKQVPLPTLDRGDTNPSPLHRHTIPNHKDTIPNNQDIIPNIIPNKAAMPPGSRNRASSLLTDRAFINDLSHGHEQSTAER